MTLAGVALVGGWPWVRHFAFPICLIFTAVPCPHVIDIPMTVGLMHGVASFTVELLNICGVAAVQHGNVIEVRGGLLGVDQACSGVRSLQAALTSSVFIGEVFRFRAGRRFILVGVGLVAALVTNVIRTYFLAWTASREGLPAVEKWHDPAGFFILSACLLGIWIAAVWMAKGIPFPKRAGDVLSGRLLPGRWMMGLSVWMLAVLAAVELWFYDDASVAESPWSLLPPGDSESVPIGEDALRQLQCDQLKASAWREPDGSEWLLYFLQWRPGPIRSRVLARVHRPDVCLSSIGLKMIQDRGTQLVEAGGYKLPFRSYTFEREGRLLYVYYGLWQTRSRRAEARGALSESEHVAGFQAVMWRERNLGQQVAELAVSGCADAAQADARFQVVLKRLLVRRLPASIGG